MLPLLVFFIFLDPGKHIFIIHICLKVELKGKLKNQSFIAFIRSKAQIYPWQNNTCSKPILPSSSEAENSAAKARQLTLAKIN